MTVVFGGRRIHWRERRVLWRIRWLRWVSRVGSGIRWLLLQMMVVGAGRIVGWVPRGGCVAEERLVKLSRRCLDSGWWWLLLGLGFRSIIRAVVCSIGRWLRFRFLLWCLRFSFNQIWFVNDFLAQQRLVQVVVDHNGRLFDGRYAAGGRIRIGVATGWWWVHDLVSWCVLSIVGGLWRHVGHFVCGQLIWIGCLVGWSLWLLLGFGAIGWNGFVHSRWIGGRRCIILTVIRICRRLRRRVVAVE